MTPAIVHQLASIIGPYATRIRMMVARAVVRAVDPSGMLQVVQVGILADEPKQSVEHFEPYGFTSHPEAGAEGVILSVGGDRSHGIVVVVTDRRYRLRGLNIGDAAIFSKGGNYAIMRANGDVEIHAPGNMKTTCDGVYRVDADKIELHARTYYQLDVHGKGSRDTWVGGTSWEQDSYQDGASNSGTEHGISPPAIPSDYP